MNNNKLPDTEEQNNLLNQLVDRFKDKFSLTPIVGAEIEFYLYDIKNINLLELKVGHIIKKEKGADQYEVDLPPSQNLSDYAESIDIVRQKIIKSSQDLGGNADFRSKPFLDDYGSSMHIHLNFLEDSDVEKYAQILCHYLPESINIFLPKQEDYLRLDSRFMAPTHISYGGNNRTTMIRIPDSMPRRIEHRLASANANPLHVIYSMLLAIEKGLDDPDQIDVYQKIFGNASDPQYVLRKII